MENKVIYIDFESLLDLRQGYLLAQGEGQREDIDKVYEYLVSDDYVYRESDKFGDIDIGKGYTETMGKPDKVILQCSIISHVLSVVGQALINSDNENKFSNKQVEDVVWVNTYPFSLTSEEKILIRNAIFSKLLTKVRIELMHIHPMNLTPSFINGSNIKIMFIYNLSKWTKYNLELLNEVPCNEVTIQTPSIYSEVMSEKEKQTIKKTGFEDVFSFTEYILSPLVNIKFLPSVFYINAIMATKVLEDFNNYSKEEIAKEAENVEIPEEVLSGSIFTEV